VNLNSRDDYVVYKTGKHSSDRLTRYQNSFGESDTNLGGLFGAYKVTLNLNTTYQEIVGFGGALTDASAVNYRKMPKAL
jgi:hypothetical protein